MILGLDISSSIVGWCLIDDSGLLLDWGYVYLKNLKTKSLFKKFDKFKKESKLNIIDKYKDKIKVVAVEEAVKKFGSGKSTANTIATLTSFNFGVCNYFYEQLGFEPYYIPVTTARKIMEIKVPKKVPPKVKKEAVRKEIEKRYPKIKWEYTRFGNPKDYCYDIADSLVIAESVRKKINEQPRDKKKSLKSNISG